MRCTKTWITLSSNDKLLIVNVLVQWAIKTASRFESQMYRRLAKKVVYTQGMLGLDGQELTMMAFALTQEAEACHNRKFAHIYRLLASRLLREKQKFHLVAFEELYELYLTPDEL
ncbi:hypothetical protein [Paenibacillus sp. HJGM_3]|uniref:hypothetical protein n=1 Tax=Paenibacillus sp. HJGM_3 TaxID=3379816 RepID=UPI003858F550